MSKFKPGDIVYFIQEEESLPYLGWIQEYANVPLIVSWAGSERTGIKMLNERDKAIVSFKNEDLMHELEVPKLKHNKEFQQTVEELMNE